jgi:hypothetical protein
MAAGMYKKLLPNYVENFITIIGNETLTAAENFDKLPLSSVKLIRLPTTEWNKYIIPPTAFISSLKKRPEGVLVEGIIKYSILSKCLLVTWLGFVFLSLISIGFYILSLFMRGNYSFTATFNNQVYELNAYPYLLIFFLVFYSIFFIYPAWMIALGWSKTRQEMPKKINEYLKVNL